MENAVWLNFALGPWNDVVCSARRMELLTRWVVMNHSQITLLS